MEKRYLELEVISRSNWGVNFKISKQTHMTYDFVSKEYVKELAAHGTEGSRLYGDQFVCPDTGIVICSCGMPDYTPDMFFVRGMSNHQDERTIVVSHSVFEQLEIAVKNYNKTFGYAEEKVFSLQDDLFVVE